MAIMTALMFASGGYSAFGQTSVDQLQQLERLLIQNDCDALYGFLSDNSEILTGTDPLAAALRDFVVQVELGLTDCLAAPPSAGPPAGPPPTETY